MNLLLQALGLNKIVIEYFMDPFKCSMAEHNRRWFHNEVLQYNLRSLERKFRSNRAPSTSNRIVPMDSVMAAAEEGRARGGGAGGGADGDGGGGAADNFSLSIMEAGVCGEQLAELTTE